jgi:hypothetical protein
MRAGIEVAPIFAATAPTGILAEHEMSDEKAVPVLTGATRSDIAILMPKPFDMVALSDGH